MKTELELLNNGLLKPANEATEKYFNKNKVGKVFEGDYKEIRDYEFHKKLFTLFIMMHDILPPPEPVEFMGKMVTPEHTLDNTRKFLTVKAGHYIVNGYPDGSIRVEAKSLKFANMSAEEFEKLYSGVINAALKVLPDTWSDEKLRETANKIIQYD